MIFSGFIGFDEIKSLDIMNIFFRIAQSLKNVSDYILEDNTIHKK